MPRALELEKAPGRVRRRGVLVNRRRWQRSEEATPGTDLWAVLASPIAQRRGVARDFASAISSKAGVGDVWITDLRNDLDVVVALEDPGVETEIRNAFIDLVCERLDPSEGELFVFAPDQVPAWVESGERLT